MVRHALISALLLLAGCGSDVRALLEEEHHMAWDVEEAVSRAEDHGPGLNTEMRTAEMQRTESCAFLAKALHVRMERELSGDGLTFSEQMWADIKLLAARVYPVPQVERCAEAHDSYVAAYRDLDHRLATMEEDPSTATLDPNASP